MISRSTWHESLGPKRAESTPSSHLVKVGNGPDQERVSLKGSDRNDGGGEEEEDGKQRSCGLRVYLTGLKEQEGRALGRFMHLRSHGETNKSVVETMRRHPPPSVERAGIVGDRPTSLARPLNRLHRPGVQSERGLTTRHLAVSSLADCDVDLPNRSKCLSEKGGPREQRELRNPCYVSQLHFRCRCILTELVF
ncbi:hypothetical protein LZ30DRAFT_338122 [Colletotrichum cereale]|nr:hypothetical protein LZ30DRAFT_338122 [Colletotrichum cereale]